jgi:cytochrome c5
VPGLARINKESAVSQDKEFFTMFFSIMFGLAVFAIILVIIASNLTSEVSGYQPDEIVIENIKPVGEVYIAGESEPPVDAPAEAVAAADSGVAAGPKSGEEVYNSHCMACHSTGAAGAPKTGDAAAWAPRIAAGMDSMLANATSGLNAMPPKGLCMSCSDAELQGAIDFIVGQSQ